MKTKLIFLLLTLAGIINFASCKKENFDTMPPETHSGKNTFGCLIDGDLFVGGWGAPWMTPVFDAAYYSTTGRLYISAYGKRDNTFGGEIGLTIDNPKENATQKFAEAYYAPASDFRPPIGTIENDTAYCITLSAVNDGICIITKFDTERKIVSGRFEFIGRCTSNYTDTTVTKQITQGRFDIKFDMFN